MRRILFCLLTLIPVCATFLGGIYAIGYAGISPLALRFAGDPTIVYDPEIGFVPRPNSQTWRSDLGTPTRAPIAYNIFTDDRGARVAGPRQSSLATVNMVTIGCSNAWGHGVEADQTFTNIAAERLGITAENLSFASYGTIHALQMLERNRDLSPKLVVYGMINPHMTRNVSRCAGSSWPFCLDQSSVRWTESGPEIRPPASNGARRALLHYIAQTEGLDPVTWVAHGLDVGLGRIIWRAGQNDEAIDRATQERILGLLLDRMAATVKAMNSRLLIVFIPTTDLEGPPAIVREVSGAGFLDMSEAFMRHGPSAWIADGHISAEGHAIVADAIASYWRDDVHALEAHRATH